MTAGQHVSKNPIKLVQLINEIAGKKYTDQNKTESERIIKGLKYMIEVKKK